MMIISMSTFKILHSNIFILLALVTSKPLGVGLNMTWHEPALIIGKIVTYQVLVATRNDTTQATVYNTTQTSYDLSQLDLYPGLYYLWVGALVNCH